MNEIFLDTSILIARTIHSPDKKKRIRERISAFDVVVTSLIVRQEYRRRFVKEADYLLRLLERKGGSMEDLLRHLATLPPKLNRKRQICLETVITVFGEGGDEPSSRLRSYLRMMLRAGMDAFDAMTDRQVVESTCQLGGLNPVAKRNGTFDLGGTKCSSCKSCGISTFARVCAEQFRKIRVHLESVRNPENAGTTDAWIAACKAVVEAPETVAALEPCYRLGDLFIAIESRDVSTFYTLNGKDSMLLAQALEQTLIVRPPQDEKEDQIFLPSERPWSLLANGTD